MNTLAITGITGHTGRFFLKELERHSFSGVIRCLVRKTSHTQFLDNSSLTIEKIIGDNTKYNDLLTLMNGANTVCHIYNIHQSVNVIRAAIECHVNRVVLVHTTGIYSKYKMASQEYRLIEAEIDKILECTDIDVTILRPTMIFGDLCDHNIHKFIKLVDKLPVMPEINHGTGKIQPVNARDLAKVYYSVCMTSNLPQKKYDISGERAISLHELFDSIGNCLGKKTRHLSIPMWFAAAIARCLKAISLGRIDLVEKILRMGENRDYDHDAATRDFGYEPESFERGLEREVNQYLNLKVTDQNETNGDNKT